MQLFQRIKSEYYAYSLVVLFILLNFFLTTRGYSIGNLIPIVLLVLYISFVSVKYLLYIIVFFTPLSVLLTSLFPKLSFDMSLPTEPLLFGLLVIFIFKLLLEKNIDKRVMNHPLSLAIYFSLAWALITCVTSTMPIVSFKFLLGRLWFFAAFYFLAIHIFFQKAEIKKYIWLYIISLSGIVIYTLINQIQTGLFNQEAAHRAMTPFYKDHTSYAAAIAFYLPVLAGFTFRSKYHFGIKFISFLLLILNLTGLVLSFTRAAWLSIFFALGIGFLVYTKIRLRTVILSISALLIVFFTFKTQIFVSLERNKTDSSADFSKHIKSISNIKSDASNLERINRWKCAIRMFYERPVFGWGPGTYMFKYAPFQVESEKTIISTNAGNGGNAHSEYLGPLAESGVLGMLNYLIIIGMALYYCIKAYRNGTDMEQKMLAMCCLLGISTYIFHGILNDFLDTDKISAPFWGFIAVVISMDIRRKENLSDNFELSDK